MPAVTSHYNPPLLSTRTKPACRMEDYPSITDMPKGFLIMKVNAFFLSLFSLGICLPTAISALECEPEEIITRDVAILGGGATGTYASVQLHDLGKSIALVEQSSFLGGHTNTYIDPVTHTATDFGVIQYVNSQATQDFLKRLQVPFTVRTPSQEKQALFDFARAVPITDSRIVLNSSMDPYDDLVSQYEYLENGLDLPDPVPEDFTISIDEFIERHHLESISDIFWVGMGNTSSMPALYLLNEVTPSINRGAREGFIYTTHENNQEIFAKAHDILHASLFLSSKATHIRRDDTGVQICLKTPAGTKLLKAQTILVTMPPTMDNMKSFDLSIEEHSLFSQFQFLGYYVSLVRLPRLSTTKASVYINVDSDTPLGQPVLPALYRIMPTNVLDLYVVEYGSEGVLSEQVAKDEILSSVGRFMDAIGLGNEEITIVALSSHTPYKIHVSPDAVSSGFYQRLYALQGQRNTFYSGAAFHMYQSSMLWAFTEKIVQRIVR